jgi:hypothetical protein
MSSRRRDKRTRWPCVVARHQESCPAHDLEAAVEGAADYIVSGDVGLLDLGSFQSIPIMRPAELIATALGGGSGRP